MHSTWAENGETDRQMVIIHVDNTLLAMRTSYRLDRRKNPHATDIERTEYAAAESLLDLQRRLFAGAVPVPGPSSSSSPLRQSMAFTAASSPLHPDAAVAPAADGARGSEERKGSISLPSTPSRSAATVVAAALDAPTFLSAPRLPRSSSTLKEVSEVTILSAFADVCRSASTSAVVTGVALTALVDMLELPCGFISTYGVYTAIEAASDTRADVLDNSSHEVLLSRIFSVYVAALSHPAAVMAEGDVYVRAIGRMMVLATLPEASQLLKRTVEKAMRAIVMALFRRLLRPSDNEAELQALVAAGTYVLQFISRLIAGEVAAFDHDGKEVTSETGFGTTASSSSSTPAIAAVSSGDERETLGERSVALVQLEGLALAQDCVLLLRCALASPACASLRDAVQNQLCRALLIAGLGTSRTIVLSQVLRTVHLVMQGASEYLIPQIYNFIRVLHLNPLETLTNELSDAGAGLPAGSPFTASPVGRSSPGSPATAMSGAAFTRLSRTQLERKQERRDILLDSLAEFCSDPRFGSFCFVHYDLSWRYASLLPQLCQVLVNNAYPMGFDARVLERYGKSRDGDAGSGRSSDNGNTLSRLRDSSGRDPLSPQRVGGFGVGGGPRPNGGARGVASGGAVVSGGSSAPGSAGRTLAGQLLQRTQRTALDATTNMIAGIALRSLEMAANTSPLKRSTATTSPDMAAATAELRAATRHALQEKDTLMQFAALFEESPMKKGIPFLLERAVRVAPGTEAVASEQHGTQLILAEPAGGREVGQALYRLSIVLNKRVLGDYIGEQGRDKPAAAGADPTAPVFFSVQFFGEQLLGFIHEFQFHNKPLLTAIREMVYLLCLPGESQKIDRVMETFALHWYEQNLSRLESGEVVKDVRVNPFHSESGAFILSFAIIMLNTDQHSGKVAQQMTKEDFVKMNRGIDEGSDVPAEYLGRVYDNVRQHEVVMADMMDRGFANETTWDLEMRPCTGFLQLAALLYHHEGGRGEGRGADANDSTSAELAALATVSAPEAAGEQLLLRDSVLHTFDPFLFQCLWKRSLLVFDGMLESAVLDVGAATVARGRSLSEAVFDVQQRLPAEMAVLESSLRGVSMLARAANALGLPAVADQCMLGLLRHVTMDLANAEEEVRQLYRSVPKMLCLAEIFVLLSDVHESLQDSWVPLARLLLDMQLMGLFLDPAVKSASSVRPSTVSDAGPVGLLLQDPGLCAAVFAPLTRPDATAPRTATGERGWFSAFFGSSEAPPISEAELNELRAAQPRIRSCVPELRTLLSLLQRITTESAHGYRCVLSLCAACSITGVNPIFAADPDQENERSVERLSEASAYAASYELALICAVVGSAAACDVLCLEHLSPLTTRIQRLLSEVAFYLEHPHSDERLRTYWVGLAERVVTASLQLMAANWRGPTGAVALEQLWACWMRAPASVFAAVAAPLTAAFLYDRVMIEGETSEYRLASSASQHPPPLLAQQQSGEMNLVLPPLSRRLTLDAAATPWSSGSEMLLLLSPFGTHAGSTTDPLVQRQVTAILNYVVRQSHYSVREDTESVVSLCLSFSVWPREATEGSERARRSCVSNAAASASVSVVPVPAANASIAAPTGASVAEILGLCGRHVLMSNTDRSPTQMDGAAAGGPPAGSVPAASEEDWYQQWVFVLRSLGALTLCSAEARDGSEAVLCLQRALLDSEARELPSSAVVAVYRDILIPLTERLCVPLAKVQTGLRWSCTDAESREDNNSIRGRQSSNSTGSGIHGGAERRRTLVGLFNTLLSPAAADGGRSAEVTQLEINSANTSTSVSTSLSRRSAASPFVSTEVKCRLLSLVPKVLLRYTALLTATKHDELLDVWRRVLGTLYAVYSSYPVSDRASEESHEETALVQEAVEETVKNMVYVMAATWKDPATPPAVTQQTTAFWPAVARLLHPFPFSEPLMDFLASEGLAEATSSLPAPGL